MQLNDTISKVEHHPSGLILLLADGTTMFLTGATFEPRHDDVIMINGQSGTIITGKAEHHVKLIRGNVLAVTEPPEDTHGCA